jgi:signal peptidase I
MFGLFESQETKAREAAANWLELADKIWCFRRDLLPAEEAEDLRRNTDGLRLQLKTKVGAAELKQGIESLEDVLRRTGGAFYPKTALVENVEFFLVAAIVIIGLKSYFVQPFKIPTNSMWPTYNGMTPEIFAKPSDEPGALKEAVRIVSRGAWPHRLDAPADGEVLVPVGGSESRWLVHCRIVPGHTWLIFPAQLREYTLFVDDRPVTVTVPFDYDFDWVVSDAFFSNGRVRSPRDFLATVQAKISAGEAVTRLVNGLPTTCVRTGRFVKAGDRLLSFDEITGDMLFVDRVSYNFVRPQVGQGFVFATRNIPGIGLDQYYIKRLVGTPGDTIQIHEPVIYRNGQPISGAQAFEMNARREGQYRGYFNGPASSGARLLLTDDETLTVPANSYFAMGDNSGSSADGRYWGFVPAKDVVGRPLFIYFPFSSHWGPAR